VQVFDVRLLEQLSRAANSFQQGKNNGLQKHFDVL
jgi:hypothetical protein